MIESRVCFWLRDLNTSVPSLLLVLGWPLKNDTKLGDNESLPRDEECAMCLIMPWDWQGCTRSSAGFIYPLAVCSIKNPQIIDKSFQHAFKWVIWTLVTSTAIFTHSSKTDLELLVWEMSSIASDSPGWVCWENSAGVTQTPSRIQWGASLVKPFFFLLFLLSLSHF